MPEVQPPTDAVDSTPEGLRAVLKDVPTVTLLSAWQHFHRGRAFAAARVVRALIHDRMEKAGRNP